MRASQTTSKARSLTTTPPTTTTTETITEATTFNERQVVKKQLTIYFSSLAPENGRKQFVKLKFVIQPEPLMLPEQKCSRFF